jgi:malate dehydrogenase (oxaloacetate-decarboxylating)(NADP+)
MKLACVRQIADLAKAEISDEVAAAYPGRELRFGPDYLIPTPFDSRLILRIAPAVAEAAAASGVAARPITDLKAYRDSLMQFVTNTGLFMRPVFMGAKTAPKRIAYAEGEEERVLRAAQVVVDEGLAQPILVGRPDIILTRIERAGLRLIPGENCEIVNPAKDERFKQYYETYHKLKARDGISPDLAKVVVRRSNYADCHPDGQNG